jgi:methionyl-tRNA formyltransferase
VRVVFMGTPEFAIPALRHLVLNEYQVVAVYTRSDKPAGRGRYLVSSPVKKAALALGLPLVKTASLKKAEVVAELADFKPDVIIVAAFGQILTRKVLDIPRYGSINIHPSLLPQHRGASPVAAAILAGNAFAGVSIMLMDEGLDTGPVLGRAQIPILAWDNNSSLTAKLSLVAAHLLGEVLSGYLRGELTPRPQNEARATYSGIVSKETGWIDWQLKAVDIWRQLRAFDPWPGCYTRWRGEVLKIIEAVPLSAVETAEIGKVIALPWAQDKAAVFGVSTGGGVLGVLRVQLEGKRIMEAAEFLRGQRQFIGVVLPC